MQRSHRQLTSADKYVILPQQHFDDSNAGAVRNHWVAFEKYVAFHIRQGKINTYDEFQNMFALTLIDISCNWVDPIMNNIPDMPTMKEKIMKRFNAWGQTL